MTMQTKKEMLQFTEWQPAGHTKWIDTTGGNTIFPVIHHPVASMPHCHLVFLTSKVQYCAKDIA